jgi:soluble lytic murein transglycosylase-like protein/Tfp pilus assembly protein PilF
MLLGRRAARAALVAVIACGGCLQDASRRIPSPTPPPSSAGVREASASRATFVDAVTRYERGDLDGARAEFRALLASYPALEDYHLAYLAAIADRMGQPQEAGALDDRLLANHAASVWVPQASARRARTALATDDSRAEAFADRARAAAGDDRDARGDALMVLAAVRARTRPREAYELYQEVRRSGAASTPAARDAALALEAAHPELLRDDPSLLLREGALLASEGRSERAVATLRAAVEATTGGDQIEALRALAKTYQQSGRVDDAVATFRTAVAAGPTSSLARFELATLLWNKDRDAEAAVLFTQILAETPRHSKYETARYALARIAEQAGRTDEAATQYRRVSAEGGGSDLAREARWRLAWMAYRGGDLVEAERAFVALGAGSEKDRAGARYWRGRVLAERGLADESRAELAGVLSEAPDTYYGDLAEQRLGAAPPPSDAPTPLAIAAPPSITLRDYHWSRSVELRTAGMNAAAARELEALTRELPDGAEREPYLLEAYTDVEAHDRALRLAQRLGAGSLSAATLAAYQYPRAYWSRVSAAADAARLDPYVVLALMRQESLFDADAVSSAAAYGLMQLLTTTASRVAGSAVDARQLCDPTTNITLGTRYLRQLLDRYDGNLAKALAAYNGGEDAVAKWERRAPGAPTDEFVETISYRETRNYVKHVLSNYRRYRRLYGAPGEQRALERAAAATDYELGGSASAATSLLASPPKPPLDISTTTSPGAT